ncbi:unnamed protein product [Rhizophagus irregularis]|nr:unnamed protein product [Rhizophagus irregularis]
MRCLLLSKLIISTVLIIFNQIILSNCTFTDIQAILIEDGIYCLDLTDIKPKPDNLFYDHPIPSVLKKYGLLMRKPANPIYFQIFLMKTCRYGKYAQVLVPNGQILFIGGQVNDVDNLLIYDTINDTIDTWQIVNTTGKTTELQMDVLLY